MGFESVEHQFLAGDAQHFFHHLFCLRTLYGQFTILVTLMFQRDIETLRLLLYPCPILINIRGIDDEEETVVSHFIDK